MKLTKLNILIAFCMFGFISNMLAQNRPFFDKSKDLLIAQFDSKPDPDDIHAQAALGSMLAHSDLAGVNAYGVAGAYGRQNGQFIDSDQLFEMVFGNGNWTDADADRTGSVRRIANKVIPILNNGGKVWVQEAGQSNITRDWVIEVQKSVSNTIVKNNVIVVQHSEWNQNLADNTSNSPAANPVVLNFVRNNTSYFYIDDGNAPFGGFGDHGPWGTPEYRSRDQKWLNQALSSPNSKAKQLWTEAERVIAIRYPNGVPYDWSFMKNGGTDFSDCVENWWIFNIGNNADSVTKFWSRYVTNTTGSNPDPDPDPTPCEGKVYEEKNGVAAVEAEGFVGQSKTGNRQWYFQNGNNSTPTPDPDASNHNGASGGGYLEILPDTRVTHGDPLENGVSFSNTPGQVAIIDYKVKFNSPGKYFVWVRAHSTGTEDNGVHVGIDGTWPASGARMQWCAGKNQWTWESKQRTNANHCGEAEKIYINVPSAGVHTISFSMREDGFEMDKFVLSKAYTKPSGNGPTAVLADCDGGGNGGGCQTISLSAISDFPNTNVSGFSPAYVDNARNALAIDASQHKDKFAAAQTTFNGESGTYNVTLNTLTETDGESSYRLVVGNTTVGTFQNPTTATDYAPAQKVFSNVTINRGSTIRVEFNSHTNGQIPEGNSTAYSRGRWTSLQFDCSDGGGNGGGENQPPTVTITNPDQNSYQVGTNVEVRVNANDVDGSITKHEVFVNNQSVDTDGANYTPYVISNVQEGNYTVRVTVTDDKGATATATKSFSVGAGQPTNDINIPGSFEAEDFSSKSGSVRVENTPGTTAGKNLGFIRNGDYTDYAIRVDETSEYTLDFYASSSGIGGTVDILESGTVVGSITLPVNGQWHNYQKYSTSVSLSSGQKALRLLFKGGSGFLYNIDKVVATKVAPVEQTVTLSPVHDAYLQGSTRYNNDMIRIEQNKRTGYLRFDLSSINGTISKADLKFTVYSDAGSGNVTIHKGNTNNWTESNLSNSNKPSKGTQLGSLNASYPIGDTKTIPLKTAEISGNSLSVIIDATSGNDFAFASKENTAASKPQLIITYTTSRDAGLEANDITIYPNPVTDRINFSGDMTGKMIRIFNIVGLKVKEVSMREAQNSIDMSGLSSGYYVVNILEPGKTNKILSTKKVLKR